jgi:serine/threonine-protein kinase
MEYLPGMTLRDLLDDYGTLTTAQALDITTAVLNALAVAHREGILHRDVKPENVMLVNDGRIKVGDFGLARPVNNATDTGQTLLGTVAYIAPELLTRTAADSRSDLYSVGIMLYEMLTGKQPFVGETPMAIAVQHAQSPMPLASEANPSVSRAIDDVIQWATQKNPADRPRDAKTMLDALKKASNQISTDTAATSVLETNISPGSIEDLTETRAIGVNPVGKQQVTENTTPIATKPKRKRRGLVRLVLILLLGIGGGAAALFLSGNLGVNTQSITVSGMSVSEATSVLTAAGLTVSDVVDQAYSDTIPEGSVITTNPELTGTLKKGTEVKLVVSLGPEPIAIPAFEGVTAEEYGATLAALKITVLETKKVFSSDAKKGNVVRLENSSGEAMSVGDTLHSGDEVVVVESAGNIPKVVGKTESAAITSLEAVSLVAKVSDITEYSDTIPEGSVIRMETEGTEVAPGDTVTLFVSKGPELVEVPVVAGMTVSSAKKLLISLGFEVTVVTEYPTDMWDQSWAKAGNTNPDGGEKVKVGSIITLYGLDQSQ